MKSKKSNSKEQKSNKVSTSCRKLFCEECDSYVCENKYDFVGGMCKSCLNSSDSSEDIFDVEEE